MQKIDINSWNRKKHYDWFSTFTNPTYGMNVKMDVTKLYHYVKNNNQSFFIGMLYLVTKGCNMVDAMRLRIIKDEVYLFDVINPSYTVKISDDNYDNVTQDYYDDYNVFYEYTKGKLCWSVLATSLPLYTVGCRCRRFPEVCSLPSCGSPA